MALLRFNWLIDFFWIGRGGTLNIASFLKMVTSPWFSFLTFLIHFRWFTWFSSNCMHIFVLFLFLYTYLCLYWVGWVMTPMCCIYSANVWRYQHNGYSSSQLATLKTLYILNWRQSLKTSRFIPWLCKCKIARTLNCGILTWVFSNNACWPVFVQVF